MGATSSYGYFVWVVAHSSDQIVFRLQRKARWVNLWSAYSTSTAYCKYSGVLQYLFRTLREAKCNGRLHHRSRGQMHRLNIAVSWYFYLHVFDIAIYLIY